MRVRLTQVRQSEPLVHVVAWWPSDGVRGRTTCLLFFDPRGRSYVRTYVHGLVAVPEKMPATCLRCIAKGES